MLGDTVRVAINITLKDVKRIKTGTRYSIPALHGLRKFFNVTMKSRHDCNLSLSEKLYGHSVTIPLDNHYGTFTTESLFEEYKRGIMDLTIDPTERQQLKIVTLEHEKDNQLRNMQSQIDSVKELLLRKDKLNSS